MSVESELLRIVESWRNKARGDYCQTYNRSMADGLEEAANEIEAFVVVTDFDNTAKDAQLAEARAALEPFARIAKRFHKLNDENVVVIEGTDITVSDLYAAAEVCAKLKGQTA